MKQCFMIVKMENNPLESKHINSAVDVNIASALFCYSAEFI